jgi:hypothetical protein
VRRALFVVATSGGVVLLACSVYALGLAQILGALGRLGWAFGAILGLSGAREVVRAMAWVRTIEGPVDLKFLDAFRARLAGEALNSLLPMGVLVGEPAKAGHVGHRLPFAIAFRGLAIEFAFYSLSLLPLFGAGLLSLLPSSAAAFAGGFVLLAALCIRSRAHLAPDRSAATAREGETPRRARHAVEKARAIVQPVIGFASRHPARAWRVLALEGAYHLLGIAEVYLILSLLSPLHAGWRSAVVLETVSRAVTMVFKVLPMRVGVDEAGAAMFANSLNLGAPTGVMLALVRKLRLLFWSAVGLILLLMRPADGPELASLSFFVTQSADRSAARQSA